MQTECAYTEKTKQSPTINDCDKCSKEYEMPHPYCCLNECNEHEFCRGCNKGINKTK